MSTTHTDSEWYEPRFATRGNGSHNTSRSTAPTSTSSTSLSIETEDGRESTGSKQQPNKRSKGKPFQKNKFQRNNNNARNPSAQRAPRDPNFQKDIPSSVVTTTPTRKFFPVYVSNFGTQKLGVITYKTLMSKNAKLCQLISEEHFIYVINIAFMNRVCQTAYLTGTAFPDGFERLTQVAKTIELPDIICRYIESIGIVELSNGAKIVPYCIENFTFRCRADFDYTQLVSDVDLDPIRNPWGISVPTILAYNENLARAKPSSINFRCISGSDTCEGRKEMAVSYRREQFGLVPLSPEKMAETDAQLGAMYQFRDDVKRSSWKKDRPTISWAITNPYFQTACFEWELIFAKMCSDSFAGPK